jgi:type IX secretion system PorP/SprF family membrane protein
MMKFRNSSILFILAFFSIFNLANAQQDAMNTQYVVNKLFFNPAYAGYREGKSITLCQRNQWIGFAGAPSTSLISYDAPLKKDEFAMGGSMFYDKVGPASKFGLMIDFAYRMKLTNRATLAFGLKATLEMYQVNLTSINLTSTYYGQTDEAFLFNSQGVPLPNIGFGVFYFKRDFYMGLSMPRMVLNKLERRSNENYSFLKGRQIPTFHYTIGRIWKINKKIKIQPNLIVRGVWGAPLSVGVYANAIFLDQITAGVFYHIGENMGIMGQWQLNRQLKVGYAVDVPLNALIRTSFGSHEVILQYVLGSKRKRIVYPRYF